MLGVGWGEMDVPTWQLGRVPSRARQAKYLSDRMHSLSEG
jgi:hypothetical protein